MVIISEELLEEMIKYIEESEETMDAVDYGGYKSVAELIKGGQMPDLYDRLKALELSLEDDAK